MEETPQHTEEISPEITHGENGLDIVVARRNAWHFGNAEEARRYFRRQHMQFKALHWGIRVLFLAGVANVARDVEQTLQTHEILTAAGAVIGGVLSLIVEGLNERNIGERVKLHGSVMRRFGPRIRNE